MRCKCEAQQTVRECLSETIRKGQAAGTAAGNDKVVAVEKVRSLALDVARDGLRNGTRHLCNGKQAGERIAEPHVGRIFRKMM